MLVTRVRIRTNDFGTLGESCFIPGKLCTSAQCSTVEGPQHLSQLIGLLYALWRFGEIFDQHHQRCTLVGL